MLLKNPLPRLKAEISSLPRLPTYIHSKLLNPKYDGYKHVVFISEKANWAIHWDGFYITRGVQAKGVQCKIDYYPRYYVHSIIHFGSLNTYTGSACRAVDPSNLVFVTVFHGNYGISKGMDDYLDTLRKNRGLIDRVVVSNSIMENRMIAWGLPRELVVRIPIGVDLDRFTTEGYRRRIDLRNSLGIPDDAVCIGSFQKDGVGWGDGFEPKWIKGPDILIEVLKRLSKNFNIHCLLTGPARGFVKRGLEKAKIPFTHHYLDNYLDIPDFYRCLDLYLVTSREEGGPKAILESMATGVPLVSTRMGMAPDVISHGLNGFIVDVDDVAGLVRCTERVLEYPEIRRAIVHEGLLTAKSFGWDSISAKYVDLYGEFA